MGVASWIGEKAFEAGRAALAKLKAFGRTRSEAEQQAELESWSQSHMPLRHDELGRCAVCGMPRASDVLHCPGPVKKWRPVRPETVKCEALYRHEELPSYFAQGCEICDPGRTRRAR